MEIAGLEGFTQFFRDYGVVSPIDKGILRRLVLDDAHLRIRVVLHAVVITVQMVGRDIQQNGNIGTEVIHIVQLERRQLDDVILMRLLSHL